MVGVFKKLLGRVGFLMVFVFVTSMVDAPVALASSNMTVEVNGQIVSFARQQPVAIGGVTFTPMREVFEALGYTVIWEDGVVAFIKGNKQLAVAVGIPAFIFNGNTFGLSSPIKLIGESVASPLAFILRTAGYNVLMDTTRNTLVITNPQPIPNIQHLIDIEATFISRPLDIQVGSSRPTGEGWLTRAMDEGRHFSPFNHYLLGRVGYHITFDEAGNRFFLDDGTNTAILSMYSPYIQINGTNYRMTTYPRMVDYNMLTRANRNVAMFPVADVLVALGHTVNYQNSGRAGGRNDVLAVTPSPITRHLTPCGNYLMLTYRTISSTAWRHIGQIENDVFSESDSGREITFLSNVMPRGGRMQHSGLRPSPTNNFGGNRDATNSRGPSDGFGDFIITNDEIVVEMWPIATTNERLIMRVTACGEYLHVSRRIGDQYAPTTQVYRNSGGYWRINFAD
ncbi:MAG: copper amine oxidase N-terminal domain-containing protein [Defluviitaleaceae bacterium]|nr:copper amine oxidase N-terminal domain-containing protein [Defluviitaleaceae bacterium]